MIRKTSPTDVARACAVAAATTLATACSLPPVRLETPEPVKIDVSVKVNIAPIKKEGADADGPVGTSRRTRMEEIQNLKNNRIVGENNKGYLAQREIPSSWKGQEDYIRRIVDAENNDRQVLYSEKSRNEKKPFEEVEKIHAQQWREKSFTGEWIQTPEGEWRQKQ
ncbi:MAG TPA: DUF1318 domain-containing protein [Verrucomicrobiae bacterium]|nr:DUF1318 domain-containing protein [Verrucomicrobiae bacterium]